MKAERFLSVTLQALLMGLMTCTLWMFAVMGADSIVSTNPPIGVLGNLGESFIVLLVNGSGTLLLILLGFRWLWDVINIFYDDICHITSKLRKLRLTYDGRLVCNGDNK